MSMFDEAAACLPGMPGFAWPEMRKGAIRGRFEIAPRHRPLHGLQCGAAGGGLS